MSARAAAVLLACALVACAGVPPEGGEVLAALMADARRVASLPEERQEAELALAQADHAKEPRLRSAVRLALLLSIPGTGFRDDEAAARELAPFSEPKTDSPLAQFAALYQRQLDELALQKRNALRLREQLTAIHAVPLPAVPPSSENPEEKEVRIVAELVTYAHGVSKLSLEDQRSELASALRAAATEPSDLTKIRLSLLFSLPGTALHDDARALALLDPLAAEGAGTPLRQFAVLLQKQVSERARDRKRVAQLKEQLDALRDIERSLIERRSKP